MAAPSIEPEWSESIASLRERTQVPAALANADLLSEAEAQWSGRLVARTSMHDLLFTRPGDTYPFPLVVRVSVDGDVFEFQLRRTDLLVAADRATRLNARAVLDAFLMQLEDA
jgi:hypothetical protein